MFFEIRNVGQNLNILGGSYMRFAIRVIGSFAFVLFVSGAAPARAQESSWGELSVTAGRVDYDLSGVGSTSGLAVRTRKDFTSNFGLEVRGLFARPCQQFQSCKE